MTSEWYERMNAVAEAERNGDLPSRVLSFGDREFVALWANTVGLREEGYRLPRANEYDAVAFPQDVVGPVAFHNVGVDIDIAIAFYDPQGERLNSAVMPAGLAEPLSQLSSVSLVIETPANSWLAPYLHEPHLNLIHFQ